MIVDGIEECERRGCRVTFTRDTVLKGHYQHGDNPEAVLEVPTVLSSVPEPAAVIRAMFRAFAERCHRYEDGVPVEETL